MSGTRPSGVSGDQQISAYVRDMFNRVAPRYDLLNHLLSFNVDRYWRRRTVRVVSSKLGSGSRVLDVCCGTGDLTLALRNAGTARVFGSDFSHPMLLGASRKSASGKLFESDALQLPLADQSMDLVTTAFGFRNLVSYERGLVELHRVLRPDGMLAILEFSTPPNAAFRSLYDFYSRRILAPIGNAISGARDAYSYLPESVRKFPDAPSLATAMRNAGFADVRFERMTFGIVALHVGIRK